MKKVHFRTQLFNGANLAAESIVLNAARSNSGFIPLNLYQLKDIGKQIADLTPDHHKGTSIEIIGENTLHVDALVNGNYETVCIVEEVEIWEVERLHDEDEEKVNILSGTN